MAERRVDSLRCWIAGLGVPLLLMALIRMVPGWPRPYTWQFLAVAMFITRSEGWKAGACSLAAGAWVAWHQASPIDGRLAIASPVVPGIAMFLVAGGCAVYIVSDLQRTRTRLRAAFHREQEANRVKDQFLAVLSHELRTPLNVVLGYTRMLLATTRSDARTERIYRTIERNAKLQLKLVEDLLDLQRIAISRFTLECGPVDVEDLVRHVGEALLPSAHARRITCRFSHEPVPLHGDASRIQQVIWNLVSNAIKFTPEGGSVDVRVFRSGAHAVFEVRDTGQGIPADFLPHVFERFRQLDMSTTRRHGGMGLGLAISKEIVERHGGRIDVESAGEGRGTTFRVTLPLECVEPFDEQNAAAAGLRESQPA